MSDKATAAKRLLKSLGAQTASGISAPASRSMSLDGIPLSKEEAVKISRTLKKELTALELDCERLGEGMEQAVDLRQLRYRCERLTAQVREAMLQLNVCSEPEGNAIITKWKEETVEDASVEIVPTVFGLKIICPFRFPSKNTYKVNHFWWRPIVWAMEEYHKENGVQIIEHVAIAYIDLYPTTTSYAKIIDADNMDIKHVTDAMFGTLISGDAADRAWIFQKAMKKSCLKKAYTEVHIMPQNRFYDWLGTWAPRA